MNIHISINKKRNKKTEKNNCVRKKSKRSFINKILRKQSIKIRYFKIKRKIYQELFNINKKLL